MFSTSSDFTSIWIAIGVGVLALVVIIVIVVVLVRLHCVRRYVENVSIKCVLKARGTVCRIIVANSM